MLKELEEESLVPRLINGRWGGRSSILYLVFVRRQLLLIQYDPPFPLFDHCGADSGSFSNGWDGPDWVLWPLRAQ